MSLYIGTSGNSVDLVAGIAKLKDDYMTLLDIFYPVGSWLGTSDKSFDPNAAWDGTTWSQDTEFQIVESSTVSTDFIMWKRTS